MARRNRAAPAAPVVDPVAAAPGPAGGVTSWLLCAILLVAAAVGVPHELMLQDTLKSIVVGVGALIALLLFFLDLRGRPAEKVRWHAVTWLPLLLAGYALGSMAWSHAYLGGVEAVRWFIFAVLVWLGLNTLARERLPSLALAIHAGAVAAATWAALQFWFDFSLFPQGPNPGSTFVNRNFFAEFVVCTLPFAWLLLARARQGGLVAALALSTGLVITAILMTGTRAALVALWLQLLVVLPLAMWRCRGQLPWAAWPRRLRLLAPALLAGTVLVLGLLPTGNPKITEELRGTTALERGLNRTGSIGPADASLGIRMVMWRATLAAIADRPLAGLGAGAWESEIPRYQAEGSQLETDYYVHNEFLQLVAEYGVVGWIFLVLLLAYLAHAGWRTWRDEGAAADAERPWRAAILCSLLVLLVVSNIGFPWRMAATGALFALCLGALAASDVRLGLAGPLLARELPWSERATHAGLAGGVACLLLAAFITQRAAESERKLASAAKLAMTITASGMPNDPRMAGPRREMLRLVREGIAINPHYRKITPMVADELARWGDWANATWVWESVLSSRPNVVAILSNAARGHSTLGDNAKARAYLERAKAIQPRAPAVRSLEVIMLAREGQEARAMALARESLAAGVVDYDLVNAMFVLAWRSGDLALAQQALQRRMAEYPDSRALGHLQLGTLYDRDLKDPARALAEFRKGLQLARPDERAELLRQVPPAYRAQLAQTSASKE